MTRRYYTSRNKPGSLTLDQLHDKLVYLFLLFRDRDFFKNKAGITKGDLSDEIKYQAALSLDFQPFPMNGWSFENITEEHVFDVLEFLYDHVSKPGEMKEFWADGESVYDYDGYDDAEGKKEFRNGANVFLADYKTGFELTEDGTILALGTQGLQPILEADIVPYDEKNVDSKVRSAITKWRNRQLSTTEKKEAIRELADVFEWLKNTKHLGSVLDTKDESALFDIANNFAIRHHNQKQKGNYDTGIWYAWMFHFYLATYHAAVRLLVKKESKKPV